GRRDAARSRAAGRSPSRTGARGQSAGGGRVQVSRVPSEITRTTSPSVIRTRNRQGTAAGVSASRSVCRWKPEASTDGRRSVGWVAGDGSRGCNRINGWGGEGRPVGVQSRLLGYIEEAWPGLAAGGDPALLQPLLDTDRRISRHNEEVL